MKLQIDTKVNVLGLEVSNTWKKVNHENNSTIFEGPVHNMQRPFGF